MLDPYPITQSMEVEFEPGTTEYAGDQYFSEHPEAMMAFLSQDPYTQESAMADFINSPSFELLSQENQQRLSPERESLNTQNNIDQNAITLQTSSNPTRNGLRLQLLHTATTPCYKTRIFMKLTFFSR